jgi:hypothetical protein
MRRGQIAVSNEIYTSEEWKDIEAELIKVFTPESVQALPFGVTAIHGTSYLFEEAIEGASPKYSCIFTTVDRKPKFLKFEKA